MKKGFGVVLLGVSAVFFLAQGAMAQVSMTLTGPPPGNTYDGIYVSPYYATVGASTNVPVVCDDFGDNTSIGDKWTATVSAFPTSTSGSINTSWGLSSSGATLAQYDEVAWFTMQLIGMPISSQTPNALTLQVIDSFALWAIFDPSGVASYLTGYGSNKYDNGLLCTDIFGASGCTGSLALVGTAYTGIPSAPPGGYSNLEVISPDMGTGPNPTLCPAGTDSCKAQEFVAMVPEGGAAFAYLFLAGFCCFGAIYTRSRRQVAIVESA